MKPPAPVTRTRLLRSISTTRRIVGNPGRGLSPEVCGPASPTRLVPGLRLRHRLQPVEAAAERAVQRLRVVGVQGLRHLAVEVDRRSTHVERQRDLADPGSRSALSATSRSPRAASLPPSRARRTTRAARSAIDQAGGDSAEAGLFQVLPCHPHSVPGAANQPRQRRRKPIDPGSSSSDTMHPIGVGSRSPNRSETNPSSEVSSPGAEQRELDRRRARRPHEPRLDAMAPLALELVDDEHLVCRSTRSAARAGRGRAARRSPRPPARARSAGSPSAAGRCGTRPRAGTGRGRRRVTVECARVERNQSRSAPGSYVNVPGSTSTGRPCHQSWNDSASACACAGRKSGDGGPQRNASQSAPSRTTTKPESANTDRPSGGSGSSSRGASTVPSLKSAGAPSGRASAAANARMRSIASAEPRVRRRRLDLEQVAQHDEVVRRAALVVAAVAAAPARAARGAAARSRAASARPRRTTLPPSTSARALRIT